MKNINFIFFALALFFLNSCNVEEEPIPAYLHVKPFLLETGSGQGSNANKFADAWLTNGSNGDFLGVYEVPATFPILENGKTNLIFEAGIKENGISATPNIYPMVDRFEIEVDLEANITDTIQPVVNYKSDVEFFYVEDFEINSPLWVVLDTFGIDPEIESSSQSDGQFATFTLDENRSLMIVAASKRMQIPKDRGETFLEINYKNEGILQLGLVGYQEGQMNGEGELAYIIALNPKQGWNKIYVDLTNDIINASQSIKEFQVLMAGQHNPSNTSTTYSVDNIKVLYRETSN